MNDAVRKTVASATNQEIVFVEFPEAKQAALEAILERIAPMIPNWIQRIYFKNLGVASDDEGAACSVHVNTCYRFAEIAVFPEFWDEDWPERVMFLVHELIHIPIEPVAETITGFIEVYIEENTPARTLLEKQLKNAIETTVQDLAHAYAALVNRYAPIPE